MTSFCYGGITIVININIMPTIIRQFEVGGVYHLVNRGVEKRKIFMKRQDYSRFILALEFFNNVDHFNFRKFQTQVYRLKSLLFR